MGLGKSLKKAFKKAGKQVTEVVKDAGDSVAGLGEDTLGFIGSDIIDPLLGSPVAKGEARAKALEEQATASAEKQRKDRIGVAASQALAVESGIASKKRNKVGSASAILTGQSGPAITR